MERLVSSHNEVSAGDLAGKYRPIAELGRGGMATVYLSVAHGNSGFRKLAVVKVLRPEFAVAPEFIEMFLDEARLCARLNHPNIVHTFDVGMDEGRHLIAMEYLDGVSMAAAVSKLGRKGGSMRFPLQAKVLLEVLEGLRYAHELRDYDGTSLNIVHRDVTPHNIFITYDGQVKLLDFGIAKAATASSQTATGVIKGKITYMAPEQALGDKVDARTDVYSIGVMLWEAVAGRRRWPKDIAEPALFIRLANGDMPERPDAASSGYPAEVDDLVMRAIAPAPVDRVQTCAELTEALTRVVRGVESPSLRELGAMLAEAFSDDRQRIRGVIEEWFRAEDNGESRSSPWALPVVQAPKGQTISVSASTSDMPATLARNLTDSHSPKTGNRVVDAVGSLSRKPALRSAAGIIAGTLVATGVTLGVAVPRFRSSARASDVHVQPVPTAPSLGSASVVVRPPEPGTAATIAIAPPPPPSARVEERPRSIGPTRVEVRPTASHEVAPPPPTVVTAAPPPSAAPSADPPSDFPPLHRETKPKVQLERDNPYP